MTTINLEKFTVGTANPTFYRTYSRLKDDYKTKESLDEVYERTLSGIEEIGNYTEEELALITEYTTSLKVFFSGRWMWVGGCEFLHKPKNYYAAYNCIGMSTEGLKDFGRAFNFLMQGCGVGASILTEELGNLPKIVNSVNLVDITDEDKIGSIKLFPKENTSLTVHLFSQQVITVGDSREGWVDAILELLNIFTLKSERKEPFELAIDLRNVRPKGSPIKGFGGVSNPADLRQMFIDFVDMFNSYVGKNWDSFLAAWCYGRVAKCTVAGNVRRCLPETALVHTSKGLVPIKNVNVGDLVQTPVGFRKVVNKFDQGVQDVYELNTNGTRPSATLNHRIAVFDNVNDIKWKTLSELVEGDRLVHSSIILPGTVTHLPEDFTEERPLHSRTAKPIIIPDLTPEVAWLIGYTHGNGYVDLGINKHNKPYGSVRWSMNHSQPELCEMLKNKIDNALSLFGLEASHTKIKGENTSSSVCTSIRLAEYFSEHVKQSKTTLVVPDFILMGSVDVRSAYVAGLFDSDGSLKTRPIQVVCTVYKTLADQVASVLSSLGIATRIKISKPTNENWQIKHLVTLPALKKDFNALIAPHSAKGAVGENNKNETFSFTNEMLRDKYSYRELQSMGFGMSKSANCSYDRLIDKTEENVDIPITFKSLSSYTSVQTYDIEVDEVHCFYCDGYLTHNSAELMQGSEKDDVFTEMKQNLWTKLDPNDDNSWQIDPTKDCLRMANHTRMFFHKPSLEEVKSAVTKQYYSGEGAIGYAPMSIIRANVDILDTVEKRDVFHDYYLTDQMFAKQLLRELGSCNNLRMDERELEHRMGRFRANPCYEIIGKDFMCNLAEVPLNQLNPLDLDEQIEAFKVNGLIVASLLHHEFNDEKFRYSRELDPIVGCSFTGLFDFFVKLFGEDWLRWWQLGRPEQCDVINFYTYSDYYLNFPEPLLQILNNWANCKGEFCSDFDGKLFKALERYLLNLWRDTASEAVGDYCDRNNLKRPNRCTTVQPAGTKSLLTGASCGWHPPKDTRYIRRVTFGKNDPVALACIDYGYTVIPSQSDKDENGKLLDDPFDPRCTEWLVEIPFEVEWADIADKAQVDISKFSASAQFDFFMQVQTHYSTHNTSSTIELRENEIDELSQNIYDAIQNNTPYISTALLGRFDDIESFPRLPFEPVSKEKYLQLTDEVLSRRKSDDFYELMTHYNNAVEFANDHGSVACESEFCAIKK